MICRYVHIGPRLTALLVQTKDISEELNDTTSCCSNSGIQSQAENSFVGNNFGFNRLWPTTATLMVCANSLHGIKSTLPKNVILLEYGFQVQYNI